MFKARGLLFCFSYFFQNHLFDILNKTDTHLRNDISDYYLKPEAFDSGIWYDCVKTNRFNESIKFVENYLKDTFQEFQFIDLGCGKGKSILLYNKKYFQNKFEAIGIEYYEPLALVAINNISKISPTSNSKIIVDDARNIKSYISTDKLIVYLYNPFDCSILENILESILNFSVIIIYIDPVCNDLILKKGFSIIKLTKGKFPSDCINIYSNFRYQ